MTQRAKSDVWNTPSSDGETPVATHQMNRSGGREGGRIQRVVRLMVACTLCGDRDCGDGEENKKVGPSMRRERRSRTGDTFNG